MSHKIITPVGTSLFDNYFLGNTPAIKASYQAIKDKAIDDWDKGMYAAHIDKVRTPVKDWAARQLAKNDYSASAEMASLIALLESGQIQAEAHVYLLATATVVARLAAEILQTLLHGYVGPGGVTIVVHFDPERDVIRGLQVTNEADFQTIGLPALIKRVETVTAHFQLTKDALHKLRHKKLSESVLARLLETPEYTHETEFLDLFKEAGLERRVLDEIVDAARVPAIQADVLFNITGGYKAVIPYLTLMAQIYERPAYYLFNEGELKSRTLLEIPRLPVQFDFSAIAENSVAFESLKKDKPENLPSVEAFKQDLHDKPGNAQEILEQLLAQQIVEIVAGRVQLSVIGRLLYARYQKLSKPEENLLSRIIELKIYEYFAAVYGADRVKQGWHLGQEVAPPMGYDFDVYIEPDDRTILAIEVKPGGNIPFFTADKGKRALEYRLTDGAFEYVVKNNPGKQVDLMVILYAPKPLHASVKEHIRTLHLTHPDKTRNLGWYWLEVISRYKSDPEWKVRQETLHHVYGKQIL